MSDPLLTAHIADTSIHGSGRELGYASITSDFTGTATSLTDIPGLSVTVTVAARPIIVKFQADFASSNAGFLGGVYLAEDGTDIGVLAGAGALAPTHGERRRAPAAGSHTYKLRYNQGSAGTFTIKAGAGNSGGVNGPAFIQVIEI